MTLVPTTPPVVTVLLLLTKLLVLTTLPVLTRRLRGSYHGVQAGEEDPDATGD